MITNEQMVAIARILGTQARAFAVVVVDANTVGSKFMIQGGCTFGDAHLLADYFLSLLSTQDGEDFRDQFQRLRHGSDHSN